MPKLDKRLTDGVARAIPLPLPTGIKVTEVIKGKTATVEKSVQVFHWCKDTTGFGLRVSSNGDRSYVSERRIEGKTVRRTLGKAVGAGAISADAARKLMLTVSSELQTGVDRVEVKREERKVEKQDGITFAIALAEYVKGKRRGKDGLPLKDRTKTDYLAMVDRGRTNKTTGKPFADGPLYPLADIALSRITADEMRKVYETEEAKSKRVAVYAMQVLRAVLNWHGVAVPDSPLAKATAGRDRIILAKTTGNPTPIPKDHLGAWWAAATAMEGNVGADGCRVILLTGCRPGEIFGSQTYKNGKTIVFATGLLVEQVDLRRKCLKLIDTKNRTNHTVHLSKQALDIVRSYCKGKAPDAKVFDVLDPGKTLDAINAAAGVVGITPHKLRHTFASVAAKLCSVFELKAMMNHAATGDVTADHYVDVDDTDLADAWQRVADFITAA